MPSYEIVLSGSENMELPATDEEYIVSRIEELQMSDETTAKAWILTAQTLLPKNFKVQFEVYKMHKQACKHEKAAKSFSYIALTFQNNNTDLWSEVNELANALRVPENETTRQQDFYVKMFQYVAFDVQQEILLLTVNHNQDNLSQCKLLLLIFKRFPQAAAPHTPKLVELIVEGMQQNLDTYIELLDKDTMPLMSLQTPPVSAGLVCRMYSIAFEFYVRQILEEGVKCDSHAVWRKIFHVLNLCGKLASWEPFLPYNKNWSHKVYWDKLVKIISGIQPGSTEVLFYALSLFVYSLHCYIRNCNAMADADPSLNYVLVEGFTEWKVANNETASATPVLSYCSDVSEELSKAFLQAAQCWQLLNSEVFQRDFSKLLAPLKLTQWLSRFLLDLSMYFNQTDEANKMISEVSFKSSLVHNIQILSLNLLQGSLTLQGFECILKIMNELPVTHGQLVEELTQNVQRHMIFIPLTQNVLVQYCAKAIVNALSRKLYEPNCRNEILGDLLVLLQLEYPRDTMMLEQIFSLITSRRAFVYRYFTPYIVTIDFLEELMHIFHAHNEEFSFDLSPAAGRRPAGETATRDDFRAAIKQQITRANENLITLTASFISQEHGRLMQNIFGEGGSDPADQSFIPVITVD